MKHLVIDTDPGVDDAHAILMAAAHPNAKIEAVTTVGGNVPLKYTTANALKILEVAGVDAPVFAGVDGALIERDHDDAAHVHGIDGLGDCGIPEAKRKPEDEHAVHALIRLANENPGKLSLIAIGPLTNIAMALRLDPELPQKFKEFFIMGGAIYGQGNTPNLPAEFNIYNDPEAAAIVFNEWPEFTLASWETTMAHPILPEDIHAITSMDTPCGIFFREITRKIIDFLKTALNRDLMYAADSVAMAALLEPDIVEKVEKRALHVELNGKTTRGMTVVDWFGLSGKTPNANILLELNQERFLELLIEALK